MYLLLKLSCGHERPSYTDKAQEYFCPICKDVSTFDVVIKTDYIAPTVTDAPQALQV